MESLIKNARDLLKKLQPIKQAFSTAGQNLQAWGQVAKSPQLRQEYKQNVIQPRIQQATPQVKSYLQARSPSRALNYPIGTTQGIGPFQTYQKGEPVALKDYFKPSSLKGGKAGQSISSAIESTMAGAWPMMGGGGAGKLALNLPKMLKSGAGFAAFTAAMNALQGKKQTVGELAGSFAMGVPFGMVGGLEVKGGQKAILQAEKAGTYALKTPKIKIKGKAAQPPMGDIGKAVTQEAKLLGKGDPVSRITEALKGAKPLRGQQEAIYTKIKSQQAGALKGIGGGLKGEAGYYQKLGQLKGEMPKVNFESIKKQISQSDVDHVFNQVEKSNLNVWEKVNAQTALRKLLGEKGGTIPTKGELNLLSEVFPTDFIRAVLDNRTTFQKLMSGTGQVINLPRAVMASADLSAPLRQGVFFIGRPKQFVPAFKDMFKYAFNEKSYKGLMEEVKVRPNYKLMREAKLSLTDMGPQLAGREEAFMSSLAEKIPGFGPIARGSNRAYSGFLNKLRADVFDDLVGSARTQGIKVEGKVLRDIGSFVNSATGRGQLPGAIEKSAVALNSVFFSPRLMASRVNLLNPAYYAKLEPFVRKEALKSLLTFGATAMSIMGLAKLGGAEVGADPRSADFGKIKVGNTRYDVLGGFQQYIRLAAQLISGKIVSSTTGRIITLGEGYKPLTRPDILRRFFEYKTSPVASFVIAMASGKNALGEDFNLPTEIANRFIPMVTQDIYDLAKEKDSIGQALVMGSPAIFGTGIQTYGKQELIQGKNQLGQPTSQVRPIPGAGEAIAEKIFGKGQLGTSKSFNVDAYYDQLLGMPKEQAAKQFDLIAKTNPDLAKKIIDVVKERQKGITVENKSLKQKGVASGDRAIAISKEFNRLKTKEEKARLWDEYVKKGIITKEVAKQLNQLLKGGL